MINKLSERKRREIATAQDKGGGRPGLRHKVLDSELFKMMGNKIKVIGKKN